MIDAFRSLYLYVMLAIITTLYAATRLGYFYQWAQSYSSDYHMIYGPKTPQDIINMLAAMVLIFAVAWGLYIWLI